jgi:hypothetical protein
MAERGVAGLDRAIRGALAEPLIDPGAALVTKDNMSVFQ